MALMTTAGNHGAAAKGRGASINPEGRFETYNRESADDGWFQEPEDGPVKPKTVIAIEQAKSVISRHNSPDVGFSQSINPYRGCSHGCVYCLWGGTPILMANGATRPLQDLRIGDEVIGTATGHGSRRYVKSRVLAHWSSVKPAFEIGMEDGTRLIASGDHRFLTGDGWKHVLDAAHEGWSRPHLRIGEFLLGSGAAPNRPGRTSIRQRGALLEVVEESPDDGRWWAPGIAVGRVTEGNRRLRVRSIRPLGGAMRLYDITTSTEDFIANGVVSHNCFARPSHAYLGLSPGLDFETRLSAKTNAAEKLREELAKPGYRCEPLTIGVNTDAYQPIEKEYRITRSILEACSESHHPVSLITKNAMIERDLDILAPMARRKLVNVTFSITTLSNETSRHMEPRASAPMRRLLAVKRLTEAGVPVSVNVAPVIPFLTDSELEPIMEAAAAHGAFAAHYTLVRLPWEVKEIFRAWLEERFPLKAAHVMSRIHEMREGRDNDPNFGTRMSGTGLFAELLRQRFEKALKRFGLDQREAEFGLDTGLFIPPALHGQKTLF